MGKLTKYQRLVLINQYDILASLAKDKYEKELYETKSEIVSNGYVRLYGDLTDFISEELPEEKSIYVKEVLDFYEDVHFSYSSLKDDEKDDSIGRKVIFKGFDLNDPEQSKLYGYADFMLYKMERWQYIKKLIDSGEVELNSHGSETNEVELSKYIERYKAIKSNRKDDHDFTSPLTLKELKEIFKQ